MLPWEWKWFFFCLLTYTLLSDILTLFRVNFKEMCAFPQEKCSIFFSSGHSRCRSRHHFHYLLSTADFWRVLRLYPLGNWWFPVKWLESLIFLHIWPTEIPFNLFSFFALPHTLRCSIKLSWIAQLCVWGRLSWDAALYRGLLRLPSASHYCYVYPIGRVWTVLSFYRILKAWIQKEKPFCSQNGFVLFLRMVSI